MQKVLAVGNRKTDGYAMFIGRWQPWHPGHRWLIDQQLDKGKKILLCVRDVPKDDKNPWSADDILIMLNNELTDLIQEGKLKVMIIPDIESINFGRGVGYDVIEYQPPQEIHDISATKIREQMKIEGKL
jgi:nicotinamide mononucleotide adenylyltransferase